MIVRRGRQFNLPVGGEFAVHGQHVAHVFVLRIQDIGQVGERVIAVLHEQGNETLVSVAGIVVALNVVRRELIEVPQDLEVKEILRRKQFVVHDGVRLEVVQGHVVEFLVPCTRRVKPTQFLITLRDVVNPAAVPERLELHGVKFQCRGVGIAAFTPRTLGNVGVNIQRFVEVVINELFNKGRHEVVGHLGVGVSQNTR